MYVCLVAWCNSKPMAASGAHPPEVPSVAGNTQADDTLPSIVGRGGANCRITPGPHTQLFGGARPPPPPLPPPLNKVPSQGGFDTPAAHAQNWTRAWLLQFYASQPGVRDPQTPEVWEQWAQAQLPPRVRDFAQRVLWHKLTV